MSMVPKTIAVNIEFKSFKCFKQGRSKHAIYEFTPSGFLLCKVADNSKGKKPRPCV